MGGGGERWRQLGEEREGNWDWYEKWKKIVLKINKCKKRIEGESQTD